jgi:3-hydroxyisobutyrate dehydrogenase-like beta-hydroxyacid dehydrogenase/predicted enzyme related to lactoylglutathione lyase
VKVAVLGTGLMGTGFARGFRARGHEVTVWNRTAAKTRGAVADGAVAAATPAEAVRGVERIFISLSDDASVDAVLDAAAPPAGVPIVDLTTTAPIPTRARAARLAAAGRQFLHAPVFMGPENARLSQGLILCAGPKDLYDTLAPELAKMTGKLWYVGAEPGRAAAFKLFGNAEGLAVAGGLADVFTMARGVGISPEEALEIFREVNVANQINFRGTRMAKGEFSATFELAMARKDLRLALETVAASGPDPRLAVLPRIAERMDELIARGLGGEDLGVLAVDALRRPPPPRRRALASTPVLAVTDLKRAIHFYEHVLGYAEPRVWDDFAMLHRDEHDLMLYVGAPAPAPDGRWNVHLRVADLAEERRAIAATGATLHADRPQETEYGMIELELRDPDGHTICLAQDVVRRAEDIGR